MSPSSTTPAATTTITTRATHRSISIFEIPLILDFICTHLSKHHLQLCLLVSHLWHDLFHPHIFHHVRFADLTPHQTWTVLNHSPHRIQSLTIDLADASLFIRPPPPLTSSSSNSNSRPWIKNNNNSLQVLHCVGFGRSFVRIYSSDLMFLKIDLSLEDQANSALLLIQSSPHLHTLLIDHIPIANAFSYFTAPVLKTISQHRTLTMIKIHFLFVPWMFLSNLVISLPEGIQELDFCFENYWYIRSSSMLPILKAPDTGRLLPALERICLRGLRQRVDSHWYLDHNYPQLHQQQQSPTPTSSSQHYTSTSDMTNIEPRVLPLLQSAPYLSHLILREYNSSLRNLLQSLVICCPDLITIELSTLISEMYEYLDYPGNNDSSSQLAIQGSLARLKEFRVEGKWSDSTSRMMAGLVARSKDTLEIAWFDRCNWERLESGCVNDSVLDPNDTWLECTSNAGEDQQEDDDEEVLTINNPFCINTDASWTHCTRLKELVLYKPSGHLLSNDDRRRDLFLPTSSTSPTSSPSTASGTTEGYSSPFTQLEKLRLSIRELHWQDCPEGYHGTQEPTSWTSSCPKRRIHGQEKREHQLGFILQVRNLFGFLKIYYPRLQYLNIEWCACPLIQDMSLDYAMGLFCQTERSEINNNNNNVKGWCWWGNVTEQDLQWLCLPWSSQSSLFQSKVTTDMTAACKQQYANKSQFLLASTDLKVTTTNTGDYSNNSNDSDDSWPLGEIYTCRVGRAWKDSFSLSTYDDFPRHSDSTCVWKKMGYYSRDYYQSEFTTTTCSCDWSTELNYAVERLAIAKESGCGGKKRIMRGVTSYRQSVIGKHNQIK